jgi:sugar lactone lactonase YvrE
MLLLFAMGIASASEQLDTTITTVAGGGVAGQLGDGGPAKSAWLQKPNDVAVDASGNVYIADYFNSLVRKVTPQGIITTIAGNGTHDFIGDGLQATQVGVAPTGLDVDAAGNVFIADYAHNRIRKVSPSGVITTVAGDGSYGFSGDGGLATSAALHGPYDVAVDKNGSLFIADLINQRIRKVLPNGIISTIAGTGESGYGGDGGPATSAKLHLPRSVAVDGGGNVYIADTENDRIRRIDVAGTIRTIAGGGPFGNDPLGKNVRLDAPTGVAVDASGHVYIAQAGHVLQMLSPTGIIHVIAGWMVGGTEVVGTQGFSGDNGPSASARLDTPAGLDLDAYGNVYFADSFNNRVRKLTPVPTPPSNPPGLDAFLPYRTIAAPGTSSSLVSADVTGDGRDDVIYSTLAGVIPDADVDYKVGIMVQQQDGTLASPVFVSYPAPANPAAYRYEGGGLAVADVDGDGLKDVLVAHASGIHMIAGSSTRAFTGRAFSPGHTQPTGELVVMDVDRNGRMDVVATSTGEPGGEFAPLAIAVYFGNGTGGVANRTVIQYVDNLRELRSGDITGSGHGSTAADGFPDLVVTLEGAQGYGGYIYYAHDGIGGFVQKHGMNTQAKYRGMTLADFNGDGRKEMAMVVDRGGPDQSVWIYGSDGSQEPINSLHGLRAYEKAVALASGDMDSNQFQDLIALHAGTNAIGYYQRAADQHASQQEAKYYLPNLNAGGTPNLALGDVNHDGNLDVIVIGELGQLVVLHGTGKKYVTRMNGGQPLVRPGVSAVNPAAVSSSSPASRVTGNGTSPARGSSDSMGPARGGLQPVSSFGRVFRFLGRTVNLRFLLAPMAAMLESMFQVEATHVPPPAKEYGPVRMQAPARSCADTDVPAKRIGNVKASPTHTTCAPSRRGIGGHMQCMINRCWNAGACR